MKESKALGILILFAFLVPIWIPFYLMLRLDLLSQPTVWELLMSYWLSFIDIFTN